MPKIVNHVNLVDGTGRVYCRALDNIVDFTEEHQNTHCAKCRMYAGSAQGNGVECEWTDTRDDVQNPHIVNDAQMESDSVTIESFKKKKK